MSVDSRLVWPITIETDIPIPSRAGGRPKRGIPRLVLPFDELAAPGIDDATGEPVLHSFFVPGAKHSTISNLAARATNSSPTKVFTSRSLEEDPRYRIPGVRVWRIR